MPVNKRTLSTPRDPINRRRIAGIRRASLFLGVAGMLAGAGLLTAGLAMAAIGSQPGNLILNPASGAVTLQPTWSTTDGCPSSFQGSAQMAEFNPDGSLASRISPTVASVTTAFSGNLDGTIKGLLHVTKITDGGTVEFAIGCWSGPGGTGTVEYVQSTFVTLSADGTTYSTSSTGGSGSPSPSSTPTHTPTPTPTPTPTHTATPTPTPTPSPTSSLLPSGAPETGAGGASGPGGSNTLLIALGATLLAGSAAAVGLAIRRGMLPPAGDDPGADWPGES